MTEKAVMGPCVMCRAGLELKVVEPEVQSKVSFHGQD